MSVNHSRVHRAAPVWISPMPLTVCARQDLQVVCDQWSLVAFFFFLGGRGWKLLFFCVCVFVCACVCVCVWLDACVCVCVYISLLFLVE